MPNGCTQSAKASPWTPHSRPVSLLLVPLLSLPQTIAIRAPIWAMPSSRQLGNLPVANHDRNQ
jgi:hypothetical protein